MCGWFYDVATGIQDEGTIPGSARPNTPEGWIWPVFGSRQDDADV